MKSYGRSGHFVVLRGLRLLGLLGHSHSVDTVYSYMGIGVYTFLMVTLLCDHAVARGF